MEGFGQRITLFGVKQAQVRRLMCIFANQDRIAMLKKTGNTVFRILTSRIALNVYAWAFFIDTVWNNNHAKDRVHGDNGYEVHIVLMHLVWFAMIYSNTLWLIPRLLLKRKYVLYLLVFLIHAALFAGIIGWYSEWLIHAFPHTEKYDYISISTPERKELTTIWDYYINVLLSTVVATQFLFSLGCLMQYFFKERRRNETLEKKQLESELMLLKSQINPHFLFNVLNSIYSLSLKKSDDAPGVILKLSDILRYMLYESRQDYVPLDKELQMLQDYIAIEQIRLSRKEAISLQIHGNAHTGRIAPAMLVSFVENAVKHGLDSRMADAYVMIDIRVAGQELYFNCRNNYLQRNNSNGHTNKAGGIGLENVRKRLELIYPGMHHLKITNENNIFEVRLTLKLNTHDLSDN